MRSFERSSITIDHCTECGGMFLDRGEIERLIAAEAAGITGTSSEAEGATRAPVTPSTALHDIIELAKQYRSSGRPRF